MPPTSRILALPNSASLDAKLWVFFAASLHNLLGGWLLEMCQKLFGGQEKETNIFKNDTKTH